MSIHLIYARARNGVIGKNGQMPWHIPEDLAHFKRTTLNHPVIMGRKTWDSLPARFRPLPGRRNIVVTRQQDWNESGAERAPSLQAAVALAGSASDKVWVIGGAQLYAQALPLAQSIEVTELALDVDGDAYAPVLGPEWIETAREQHMAASGLPFSFVRMERR